MYICMSNLASGLEPILSGQSTCVHQRPPSFTCKIPSGHQTWQWTIRHLDSHRFPLIPQFSGDFSLPRLIMQGNYVIRSSFAADIEHLSDPSLPNLGVPGPRSPAPESI